MSICQSFPQTSSPVPILLSLLRAIGHQALALLSEDNVDSMLPL